MGQVKQSLIWMVVMFFLGGALFGQRQGATPEILNPIVDKNHGKWCTGDLLLDQEPNLSFSLWSEATCHGCAVGDSPPQQVLAEDFQPQEDTVVTEVVIWGWYFDGNTPPPMETWTVRFYTDAPDAVPGGEAAPSQTLTPVSRTATGRTADILGVTVDEYRWLLRLETPVPLSVGPFYWIEAFHDSPVADADTSIGFADLDPVRGAAGFTSSASAPGDAWRKETEELAIQICGVNAAWNGLMLPGYSLDMANPGGPTSFLAVRNTTDAPQNIHVAYYGENLDDGPLRVDGVNLDAGGTYTHNLRANLQGLDPDNDGVANGFVVVTDGNGDADTLTGDVLRVDFANDFATGERLLAFDDFCLNQEIRFVDFGSGSEFNVVLRDPPASGPVMTVTSFDEAGNQLAQVNVTDRRQVQRIPIDNLVANQSFGTLVFDFGPSQGGVVTARYSAFGRFSTELRGACRP